MTEKICPHGTSASSFCKACERGEPAPQSVTAADVATQTAPVARGVLSRVEARRLTDRIKSDAETLWRHLVDAHDRGAHTALGFASWGDYCSAEFGFSQSKGYRLLTAGRVAEVAAHSPTGESPRLTERQTRELGPLLNDPPQLREALKEATEDAAAEGKPLTSERIKEKVAKRLPRRAKTAAAQLPGQLNIFESLPGLARHENALVWAADAEDAGMTMVEWTAAALDAAREFVRGSAKVASL